MKFCKIPGSFTSIERLKTLKKKWNKTVFLISFIKRVIACGIKYSMIIIKNSRPYYIKEVFRDLMILASTIQYTIHYIPTEKRNMVYFQRVKKKINRDLCIAFDHVTAMPTVWQLLNIKYSKWIWYFTVLMMIGHVLISNCYGTQSRLYLYRSHSRGRSSAAPTHHMAPHTQCAHTEDTCSFYLHILQKDNKGKSQRILFYKDTVL